MQSKVKSNEWNGMEWNVMGNDNDNDFGAIKEFNFWDWTLIQKYLFLI